MNEKELARVIAANISAEVAAETERQLAGELPPNDQATRAIGLAEVAILSNILIPATHLAMQFLQTRQDRKERLDRTLLLEELLAKVPGPGDRRYSQLVFPQMPLARHPLCRGRH